MRLVDDIMARPAGERLDYALYVIDLLAGAEDMAFDWLRTKWGLTPSEARVFAALNAVAPATVSREGLFTACCGLNSEAEMKTLTAVVCRVRAKTGLVIRSRHSQGYALGRRVDIPLNPAARLDLTGKDGERWLPEEDAELLRMVRTGSDLDAISEELDRKPQAVRHRLLELRYVKKVAA